MKNYIQSGRIFDFSQQWEFCLNIIEGMYAIHSANYLHKDLACRNLLLFENPKYNLNHSEIKKKHEIKLKINILKEFRENNKNNYFHEQRLPKLLFIKIIDYLEINEYCHEKNQFIVKISDLGLAREGNYYQGNKNTKMAWKWTCPDTLRTFKFSQAGDVYSFAMTMYEIFAERQPYFEPRGDKTRDPINEIINGKRPYLEDLSEEKCPKKIKNLMIECWNQDRKKRPTFEQLFERFILQNERTIKNKKKQEYLYEIKEIKQVIIEEKIGSGAFGDVYKGIWKNNIVALKCLKDSKAQEQFKKEAKTLNKIEHHPNIIQFFGEFKKINNKGEIEKNYLVFEYANSGNLLTLLKVI